LTRIGENDVRFETGKVKSDWTFPLHFFFGISAIGFLKPLLRKKNISIAEGFPSELVTNLRRFSLCKNIFILLISLKLSIEVTSKQDSAKKRYLASASNYFGS
jgi:hypothetical protein